MGSASVHQALWLPHRPRHIYIAGTLLEDPLGCIDSWCLKQILISSWSNVIQTKPNSGKWSILSLLVTSPQEHRLCDGTLAFCQMEAILQRPKKNLELIKPQNLFEIIFSSRKMRVVQDYAQLLHPAVQGGMFSGRSERLLPEFWDPDFSRVLGSEFFSRHVVRSLGFKNISVLTLWLFIFEYLFVFRCM